MNKEQLDLLEKKGVKTVLDEMAMGHHGNPGSKTRDEVEAWLRSKQVVADVEAASKRDSREEETLAVAKEANSFARAANAIAREEAAAAARSARWAKIAAIIAAIAAIASSIISTLGD